MEKKTRVPDKTQILAQTLDSKTSVLFPDL